MKKVFKEKVLFNDKESNLSVGLYLGFVFTVLSIGQTVTYYITRRTFSGVFSEAWVHLSIFVALFFIVTSIFPGRITKIMQTSAAVILGLLLVAITSYRSFDEAGYIIINGEIFVVLGIMTGRMYRVFKKRISQHLIGLIILCYLIKIVVFYKDILENPIEFLNYIILSLFYTLFFLIIINSRDKQLSLEAGTICSQWSSEQIYSDIGKSVYSNFTQENHGECAISRLEDLKLKLKAGTVDEALKLTDELSEILVNERENILRLKEKIKLTERDRPEVIDTYKIVEERVKYFRKRYNLEKDELQSFYRKDDIHDIFVIPLDFIGIIESLLTNAIEASKDIKKIKVLISIDKKGGEILVSNKGETIPWAENSGIVPIESFRVGRTTKKDGAGWGVFTIIKRVLKSNGKIKVYSKNRTTEFSIILPVKKANREIIEVLP